MRQTVKKLTERRREVNARLAAEDAKNRCATCKAPLPKTGAILVALSSQPRFCSEACLPVPASAS